MILIIHADCEKELLPPTKEEFEAANKPNTNLPPTREEYEAAKEKDKHFY